MSRYRYEVAAVTGHSEMERTTVFDAMTMRSLRNLGLLVRITTYSVHTSCISIQATKFEWTRAADVASILDAFIRWAALQWLLFVRAFAAQRGP